MSVSDLLDHAPNDGVSDHEAQTRRHENLAATETLPRWVLIVLTISAIATLLWIYWLLSWLF
jgi:hypothetical protein